MTVFYNKHDKPHMIAGLVILPGQNEVDNATFESLKGHETFKHMLDKKVFKVIKSGESTMEEILKEIDPAMSEEKKEELKKELKPKRVFGTFSRKDIKEKK